MEEERKVSFLEGDGESQGVGSGEELPLGGEVVFGFAAAVEEQGECGPNIVDGVVGVCAFEVEGFEEFFEFVDTQAGFDKPRQFEGVEALPMAKVGAEGAADIMVQDVVVEFDIVTDEGVALAVVEKAG